ncbi:MAG: signal peptidase II [bacterium]
MAYLGVILFSGSLLFLDQITKIWAFTYLPFVVDFYVIPGFFSLKLVFNYGMAWGVLQHYRVFLLSVHALVLLGLIWFWKRFYESYWTRFALPWLLAGVLGNGLDRFFRGYVIDFLSFGRFPVFNFADMYLTIAAVFLLIGFFRKDAFFS